MHPDGDIHLSVIRQQAKLFANDKVAGVFICGTTGEGPSLSTAERKAVAEAWLEARAAGFTVIVNVGHDSLREAQALADHARAVHADAVAMHPPSYFRPQSVASLVECCRPVAEAAGNLPFYYYHIPPLTGVSVPMVEFLRCGRRAIPTLNGVKFSDRNLAEYKSCLDLDGRAFDILYGVDEMLIGALALGGTRAIGSTYCYAAPLYRNMIDAFNSGDLNRARTLAALAVGLSEAISAVDPVAAGKVCMAVRGVDCGPVRPPLRTLSDRERARLEERLRELHIFEFTP